MPKDLVVPEDLEDGEFESAFDEAVSAEAKANDPEAKYEVVPEQKEEEQKEEEQKEEEQKEADPETRKEEEEKQKVAESGEESGPEVKDNARASGKNPSKKAEPESREVLEQKYRTLQGKYNAELAAARAKEQQLAAEREAYRQQLEAEKAAKQKQAAETGEDPDEFVRELEQEAPTVHKAVSRLLQKQRQEIESAVAARINPISQTQEQRARDEHFSAIRAAHADLDDLRDDLTGWVRQQPSYLRAAYEPVLAQGNTGDVIDLISRFKESTGRGQPKQSEAEKKPNTQQSRRQQQLEDSVAVRSRAPATSLRSAGSSSPDDFGSAFEEAAARS